MLAVLLLNRMRMRRRAVRCAIKPMRVEKDNTEDSVCRTCLNSKNLTQIFDSQDAEKTSMELQLVTGLEVVLKESTVGFTSVIEKQ